MASDGFRVESKPRSQNHKREESAPTKDEIKLVIYPGETSRILEDGREHWFGHLYVVGANEEPAEIAAGPRYKRQDSSGNWEIPTPSGTFRMGSAVHHVTPRWGNSVIPYGTKLHNNNGIIQYKSGAHWISVTGENGVMTKVVMREQEKKGRPVTWQVASEASFEHCSKKTNHFIQAWLWNDFGPWAWLIDPGKGIYIHTTPDNEAQQKENEAQQEKKEDPLIKIEDHVKLMDSHGCIHLKPADRKRLMEKGYLKRDMKVEVKPYGLSGPPK